MGNGVPQPAGKGVDAWWNEALDVNGIDSGFWYAYRNPVDLTEPAILFMEEGSALSFYTGETSWASNLLSTYDNISNGTDVLWVLNEFLQAYVYSESSSFQTTFDGPYSNP
jgi:hypothetical protein